MFAECKNCKWRSDNFTSVCVNGESERRADFVCEDDSCEKWEEKEMDEREGVIYDIERCICRAPDACRDCSKYSDDSTVIRCMEELLKDALALLKAQEPRVMTLEEVLEQNWDYCYLEYDAVRGREAQIFSGGRHRLTCVTWPSITSMRLSPGDKEYGKRWRCWTSRPTDEQREAVKWND